MVIRRNMRKAPQIPIQHFCCLDGNLQIFRTRLQIRSTYYFYGRWLLARCDLIQPVDVDCIASTVEINPTKSDRFLSVTMARGIPPPQPLVKFVSALTSASFQRAFATPKR